MGLVIARNGADLMSGENTNVVADYEGTVSLAPLFNLIPDPLLQDFAADGLEHRYWDFYAAERPTHWGVYMRDNKTVTNFSRQTMAQLPLEQSTYQHVDELIRGAGPIDAANALPITNPAYPQVETFQVGQHVGFPAGWVSLAFGWVMGPRHWSLSTYWTPPGGRTEPMEIAQGQGLQITLPQTEIPAGVVGIIVYMTYPAATSNGALNATMYPQQRAPAKTFNTMARLVGPFSKRYPADVNTNRTYWGTNLPAPRVYNTSSNWYHRRIIQVQMSYTLYSSKGTSSKSSNVYPSRTGYVHRVPKGRTKAVFYPPRFPDGAVEWQPEVRFYVHNKWTAWYKIVKEGSKSGKFRRNERAPVLRAGPDYWPERSNTSVKKLASKDTEDNTGVGAPEESLEVPSLVDLNSSGLTPGAHQTKTSFFVGDSEGQVSPARWTWVDMGEGLRVKKPLFHNKLPNANASELSTDDPDIPNGWWLYKEYPSGRTCTRIKGGVNVTDRTGTTTNAAVFHTPHAILHTDEDEYTLRFRVTSDDFTGGSALAYLQEYDANEVLIKTTLVAQLRGSYTRRIRLALKRQATDPSNINVISISPSAAYVRVRVNTTGNSQIGGANYSYNFTHWGVFEGWGDPREIEMEKLTHKRAGKEEIEEYGYPEGGYCVVVEDPDDGPPESISDRLHYTAYENGLPAIWTTVESDPNVLDTAVAPSNDLSGQYALRFAKTDTVNSATTHYIYANFPEATTELALASDAYLKSYDPTGVTSHQMFLGGLRAANGQKLVEIYWNYGTGRLISRSYAGGGTSTNILSTSVQLEDTISFEMHAFDSNSTNGKLRIYAGTNKSNRQMVLDVSGLDWSGRIPYRTELGFVHTGANPPRAYEMWFDRTEVTLNSTQASTQQPGNYIEYYGPARTPIGRYGPEGLKVPVKPSTTYTLGVNMWCRGVRGLQYTSDILQFKSMTDQGTLDINHGPLVDNIVGDRDWKRHFYTFTTGADTSYIEFYGNTLSAGTVKIHGLMLSKGSTQRKFNGNNELSGSFNVNLSTKLPDLDNPNDPAYYLSHVNGIRDAMVIGTEEEDITDFSVEYRYGSSINNLSAPTIDPLEIPRTASVVQVGVDLTSTTRTDSPEVEEIQLDIERPVSQLCRADGTEYAGGVIVRNIGAPLPVRNVINREKANNKMVKTTKGNEPVKWFKDLVLEAHRDSTVSDIISAYGYGESEYVLEQADKRYTIVFEEMPEFQVKAKSRIKREGQEDFVVHEATGVNAWIVGED